MRLRTRQEYQRMAYKSFKFTGRWILADICITQAPFPRLGITVTKRYGPAPQRNRFKRLVREAFRLGRAQLMPTLDIVIRPRSQAVQATIQDIQQELIHFAQRASHLFFLKHNNSTEIKSE